MPAEGYDPVGTVDGPHAMEQIVEYKNDPGNGYTRAQLAFAERKRG